MTTTNTNKKYEDSNYQSQDNPQPTNQMLVVKKQQKIEKVQNERPIQYIW